MVQQNTCEQHGKQQKMKEPNEDKFLIEMYSLVSKAINSNNPLATEIEHIVNSYAKLLRRFNKIVALSDSYQSQLREFNLQLELMAHTDPLTGANNRRYFMELLNMELNRSSRNNHVFCVLMLDIDHFKFVNDTYGHAAGDEALRSLHQVLLKSELRSIDFFGRLGGEEFAIVLPDTDINGAAIVAEKVRINIEKTAVHFQDRVFYITASIGISEYTSGDDEDTLLQRADHAMYHAKESGRNRVVTAGP